MTAHENSQLILVGATGLVGTHVVQQYPDSNTKQFNQLLCLVRHPEESQCAQIVYRVVDFDNLDAVGANLLGNAMIITLGTTIAKAGSREAFRSVDYDLVISLATIAKEQGVQTLAVVSSLGADPSTKNFYLRTKGEMEQTLRSMEFRSLTIVRPSLLAGERQEHRLGEKLGLIAGKLFKPLIPSKYRPVAANDVAHHLLRAVSTAEPGVHVVESNQIKRS